MNLEIENNRLLLDLKGAMKVLAVSDRPQEDVFVASGGFRLRRLQYADASWLSRALLLL